MNKGLWNLFIIYVSTSVEWLFTLAYKYLIIAVPGDGVAPNSMLLSSIQETFVFAVVFYALAHAGLIRVRSAFGLVLAVIFSDLLYYYAYRPGLEILSYDSLLDSYPMRIAIFILLYSAALMFFSTRDEKVVAAQTSWFPSDDRVYAFFRNFFTLFVVAVLFATAVVLFIQYTATLGIVPMWSWQVAIFTVEAIALPMTGFVYLLFTLFLPHAFDERRVLMKTAASAYVGLIVALLPINAALQFVPGTRLSTVLFLVLAAASLYGGAITYIRFFTRT